MKNEKREVKKPVKEAKVVQVVKQEKVVNTTVPLVLEDAKIWSEIKDKSIEIFSLPNQVVSQYCTPQSVEPTKCYLICKTGAVIPAVEAALGVRYKLELVDKYLVVSRV